MPQDQSRPSPLPTLLTKRGGAHSPRLMETWTALTTLGDRERAEALGRALEALDPEPSGIGVIMLEDGSGIWEVGCYFADAPDEIALALLAAAHGAAEFTISQLPDADWVAHVRRELAPVDAGRFLVDCGSGVEIAPEGRILIRIEASMAFGTGHHCTTLGCLNALDRLVGNGAIIREVADIGCGTAVLAMAAQLACGAEVLASDVDPVAIEVARANLAANGLEDCVTLVETSGFDDSRLAGPFDLVLANILRDPLLGMANDMALALREGGHAVLSGILIEQADHLAKHYASAGFGLHVREDIGEWATLTLVRTSS